MLSICRRRGNQACNELARARISRPSGTLERVHAALGDVHYRREGAALRLEFRWKPPVFFRPASDPKGRLKRIEGNTVTLEPGATVASGEFQLEFILD